MLFKSRYHAMKYATEQGILPEDITILREKNGGYMLYIKASQNIITMYIAEKRRK